MDATVGSLYDYSIQLTNLKFEAKNQSSSGLMKALIIA